MTIDLIKNGFRLYYYEVGKSRDEAFAQAETDVEEALAELHSAQAHEVTVKQDCALRLAFEEGDELPTTDDHRRIMAKSVKKHEFSKSKARKKRLALQEELEKRIKARDSAIDRINNEAAVKKPNQIYCSNGIYTARWTALPA